MALYLNDASSVIRSLSDQVLREEQIEGQRIRKAQAQISSRDDVRPSSSGEVSSPAGSPSTPVIPSPSNSSPSDNAIDDSGSIIAIIGQVLILQAKSNSNFWSTVWKQASQSMELSVSQAKIMAQAIVDSANQQSAATQAEADMAQKDGIAGFTTGLLCLGMGLYGSFTDPAEKAADAGVTNETDEAASTMQKDAVKAENSSEKEINETINKENTASSKAQRFFKSFNSWRERGMKGLMKAFEKAAAAGQTFMPLSQASSQLFVDSPAKTAIAQMQKAKGAADALEKQAEQFAQYYNQDFQRVEGLRESSQQNLNEALQVLQKASDGLTAVVNRMFQG